jgi:hypothetical protein
MANKCRSVRRMGKRLDAGYEMQTGYITTELAVHFERGRDSRRALMYLR